MCASRSTAAEIATKAVFVSVANAQYLAGGFHFAPMARIDDGLLDLAIIDDISLPGFVKAVPSVMRGKHLSNPHWSHYTTTHVRVSSATPALVQLDGEIAGTSPAEFTDGAGRARHRGETVVTELPVPSRKFLEEIGVRPSKGRGQNFLKEAWVVERMAAELGIGTGDLVVEVGPGLGALTGALLDTGATVRAIELDDQLAAYLQAPAHFG